MLRTALHARHFGRSAGAASHADPARGNGIGKDFGGGTQRNRSKGEGGLFKGSFPRSRQPIETRVAVRQCWRMLCREEASMPERNTDREKLAARISG